MTAPLLPLAEAHAAYALFRVLTASAWKRAGELSSLLGRNGAGKSTTVCFQRPLRALSRATMICGERISPCEGDV